MINNSLLMIICLILLQVVIGNDQSMISISYENAIFALCENKTKRKIKIY